MPVVSLNRDCPGYAEAAAREEELRALAVLGLPETITVGNHRLELAPLTLRRLQLLTLVRSPFLTKLPPALLLEKPNLPQDVMSFLWICSPAFQPGHVRARNRFFRRHQWALTVPAEALLGQLQTYVEEAFLDAGAPSQGEERSYYSAAAQFTGFFHKHYGLAVDIWENGFWRNLVRRLTGQPNVLDIPLKLAYQLIRVQRRSQQPDATFYNRLSQPKVDDWLKKLNGRN